MEEKQKEYKEDQEFNANDEKPVNFFRANKLPGMPARSKNPLINARVKKSELQEMIWDILERIQFIPSYHTTSAEVCFKLGLIYGEFYQKIQAYETNLLRMKEEEAWSCAGCASPFYVLRFLFKKEGKEYCCKECFEKNEKEDANVPN